MDKPKNKRIVCLGLIVADILVRGVPTPFDFDIDTHFVNEISLQSGGDANNQAQTLAKLGSQVAIAGRIGHDAIGEILYKKICSLGIDTTALEIADNCKTDFSVVLITETGKRTFLFQPGGNNDFCLGKHIYNHIFRRADRTKYEREQEDLMQKVQQIFDDSGQRFGAEKIAVAFDLFQRRKNK